MDIKWLENNRIQVKPPKKPKKITGTKFASILGLNKWSTPFEVWCDITKTYKVPFEDTIYTIAGKTIEPKQADYMERSYGMDLIRPKDLYGEDYFEKTWGDFFPDSDKFGGMWDYLGKDENGKVDTVFEMKTSKRVEDWEKDIPEYYALQAALYAWLLKVDHVVMVASFLDASDYDHPENYVPSAKNTITVEFKVSERYPNFEELIQKVTTWWNEHILTGISPEYDEKKDAEILEALRTNSLSPETDIESLVQEAENLKDEIDSVEATIADKEKRLKQINNVIKQDALKKFREGDKKVEIKGIRYNWVVSKSSTTIIDKDALKADGLLEKYSKKSETYRMSMKKGDKE